MVALSPGATTGEKLTSSDKAHAQLFLTFGAAKNRPLHSPLNQENYKVIANQLLDEDAAVVFAGSWRA